MDQLEQKRIQKLVKEKITDESLQIAGISREQLLALVDDFLSEERFRKSKAVQRLTELQEKLAKKSDLDLISEINEVLESIVTPETTERDRKLEEYVEGRLQVLGK